MVAARDALPPDEAATLANHQRKVEEWLAGTSPLLPIHVFACEPPISERVAHELVWWARRLGCTAERNGDVISIRRLRR
jgi:hypothetical protein